MFETDSPLLEVRDLVVAFRTDAGELRAVDGVSFEVPRGIARWAWSARAAPARA